MRWTRSLIRVREHDVEEGRKRLGAVVAARNDVAEALERLEAERRQELQRAAEDTHALFALPAWRAGWDARRAELLARDHRLALEEEGCRAALSEVYTDLKKVELVAAGHARTAARREAQRETAALDELALRAAARKEAP